MCGRFVSTNSPDEIAAYFGASLDDALADTIGDAAVVPEPNYNVAPTNDILAVVERPDGGRTVRSYRWGLVPSWAKDVKIGAKMINARAETLAEKSAFKGPLQKHRLIVPMDGFYEWQVVPGQKAKQPMYIHRIDGEPLAVAGLWAAWRDRSRADDDAAWLHSCTVITTAANETMSVVHDRMPAVLPASRWDEWLDPANRDLASLQHLLLPAPEHLLTMHAVSTEVNNVRNRGPELLQPIG